MLSRSYTKNKKSIYNWRIANPEKNREINKLAKRRFDCWKKVKREFLTILLI